jgi:hypothetical protein
MSLVTFFFNSEQLIQCLEAVLRIHIQDPVPSIPKDPQKSFLGSRSHIFESLVMKFGDRKLCNMNKNQNIVWISE